MVGLQCFFGVINLFIHGTAFSNPFTNIYAISMMLNLWDKSILTYKAIHNGIFYLDGKQREKYNDGTTSNQEVFIYRVFHKRYIFICNLCHEKHYFGVHSFNVHYILLHFSTRKLFSDKYFLFWGMMLMLRRPS